MKQQKQYTCKAAFLIFVTQNLAMFRDKAKNKLVYIHGNMIVVE